jgi:hypothetical protein
MIMHNIASNILNIDTLRLLALDDEAAANQVLLWELHSVLEL